LPEPGEHVKQLGPRGPFPDAPLVGVLERRWLHYAFLSRDGALAMVANLSWLGRDEPRPTDEALRMSILLLHERGLGWHGSQFHARAADEPWSAFRLPHAFDDPRDFSLAAVQGTPAVRFRLQRSSRPCTSQCAPFADGQYLRWQSEPGVLATGDWLCGPRRYADRPAVGYHERVRGRWGWPEMGGWIFGFANDPGGAPERPPPTALVFTLIQPPAPADAATGSVMIWRDGRLRRHFPRRCIEVVARGELDRDRVTQVPPLADLFGVPPMPTIPRRLLITARSGDDWATLDFTCETAARIVIPNERGLAPYSVHEVVGPCRIEGRCGRELFAFEFLGIVEFAGGADAY
jgi:hypothetical protein